MGLLTLRPYSGTQYSGGTRVLTPQNSTGCTFQEPSCQGRGGLAHRMGGPIHELLCSGRKSPFGVSYICRQQRSLTGMPNGTARAKATGRGRQPRRPAGCSSDLDLGLGLGLGRIAVVSSAALGRVQLLPVAKAHYAGAQRHQGRCISHTQESVSCNDCNEEGTPCVIHVAQLALPKL